MRRTPTTIAQQGFSLVELMIALFVGLFVILAATSFVGRASQEAGLAREQAETEGTQEHVSQRFTADSESVGRHLTLFVGEPADSTTFEDEVLADSPELWWRLNEPAGSARVDDRTEHNHEGIATGPRTFGVAGAVVSRQDFGVRLNGTVSRIRNTSLTVPSGAFTVEWWLKPESTTDFNQALGGGPDAAPSWFFTTTASASVFCGTGSAAAQFFGPAEVPPGTIRIGEWQHLAYTHDGVTARLYHNGRQIAAENHSLPANWTGLLLGNIHGGIDEVVVYRRALSTERIRTHFIAAVAPPVPQDTIGFRTPLLPLAKWPDAAFTRPDGPVNVNAAQNKMLLLSSDADFSPVETQAAFTAGTSAQTLKTRKGTRAAPAAGDYLLVLDFESQRSVLVKATGAASESPSASRPAETDWDIPVEPVTTADPAWGQLASDSADLTNTLRAGSSVVRLTPPVVYSLKSGRLVRSVGLAEHTLGIGATTFSVRRATGTANQSWVVSYQVEGEAVEGSSDTNWKQKEAVSLPFTPPALNPPPTFN